MTRKLCEAMAVRERPLYRECLTADTIFDGQYAHSVGVSHRDLKPEVSRLVDPAGDRRLNPDAPAHLTYRTSSLPRPTRRNRKSPILGWRKWSLKRLISKCVCLYISIFSTLSTGFSLDNVWDTRIPSPRSRDSRTRRLHG
jgi:hypothetical protein